MSNIESVVESVDVIIDAYVASWNETDPAKRKSALAASCAKDARYRDPVMVSEGQAGLDAMLAGVQAKFPGFVLKRISKVDSQASISRRCRLTASSRTSWASSTRCPADHSSIARGAPPVYPGGALLFSASNGSSVRNRTSETARRPSGLRHPPETIRAQNSRTVQPIRRVQL